MPFGTQIRSVLIPADVWYEGTHRASHIPPPNLPARDALTIERRSTKKVDMRSEKRRYTLCCERIQGIACELSYLPYVLPKVFIWPTSEDSSEKYPSAPALFAVTTHIYWWIRQVKKRGYLSEGQNSAFYPRIHTLFFPPDHARAHLECFEMIKDHQMVHKLYEHGAETTAEKPFAVSAAQCQKALHMRYELLIAVAANNYGLVDVWEVA